LAFSHFESDECGALNNFLAVAPSAVAVCSQVAAMVSVEDFADRAPRPMADGEVLTTGRRRLRWFDAPHVPHGWETGFLFEETTKTLLCGDLFTQGGTGEVALTQSDILGPSEAFRKPMDYFSHSRHAGKIIERMASVEPRTLAVMHGSAWSGEGGALLRQLAKRSRRSGSARGEAAAGRVDRAPLAQSGHSASRPGRHRGESSERAGTVKAPAGTPRSTIEPTAITRPPATSTAAAASRVDLPVVKTSSTTTTRSPPARENPRRSENAPS
jgi:hypothetical protein